MSRLLITIIAKENWKYIDQWLFHTVQSPFFKDVDVIVIDSQENDELHTIVNNFIFDGFTNIFYYQEKNKVINNKNLLQRIYRKYKKKYDYLWIQSCDYLFDLKEIHPIIEQSNINHTELIILTPQWMTEDKTIRQTYFDSVLLFERKNSQISIIDNVIVSASLANRLSELSTTENEKDFGIWLMESIFKIFADSKIHADSYLIQNMTNNVVANYYIQQNPITLWCRDWYSAIMNLPSCYDEYKKQALRIPRYFHNSFSVHSLLIALGSGMITRRDIKKNYSIIPLVSDLSQDRLKVVLMTPKWIARIITKKQNSSLVKIFMGIYYVLCGIVPGEENL